MQPRSVPHVRKLLAGLLELLLVAHREALYEVMRDNLETLYGAIDDGAIAVR